MNGNICRFENLKFFFFKGKLIFFSQIKSTNQIKIDAFHFIKHTFEVLSSHPLCIIHKLIGVKKLKKMGKGRENERWLENVASQEDHRCVGRKNTYLHEMSHNRKNKRSPDRAASGTSFSLPYPPRRSCTREETYFPLLFSRINLTRGFMHTAYWTTPRGSDGAEVRSRKQYSRCNSYRSRSRIFFTALGKYCDKEKSIFSVKRTGWIRLFVLLRVSRPEEHFRDEFSGASRSQCV